jgi:hypothetical protein
MQVPCVHLPADVDLGDIHPWAATLESAIELTSEGKTSAFLYFVENANQLKAIRDDLKSAYQAKVAFWLCFPRKPFFGTDLSSEKSLKLMKKAGMKGRREEVLDQRWVGIYFAKRKTK